VAQINRNLDVTLPIAQGIKGDTGSIVVEAQAADHWASCINQRVPPSAACS
jgi:hypothetical protein